MYNKNQILLTKKKKNNITLNKSYQKGGIKIILDGYDIYNFSSNLKLLYHNPFEYSQ